MARDQTTVTVFAVGGTGESFPGDPRTAVSGLLSAVTTSLDARFRTVWIGYPASYGPVPSRDGMSYQRSVAQGAAALREALATCETPAMVIGYSQGCVVVRAVLSTMPAGNDEGALVIAAGFVADPHQPPGVVPGCDGWGIAGPGADLPHDVEALWIADPRDMICNAGPDSVLRDLADLTGRLSVGDVSAWVRHAWGMVRGGTMQNAARTALRPSQWRRDVTRLRNACRDILGYLPVSILWRGMRWFNRRGGRHTSYALEPYPFRPRSAGALSGCQLLAQWMQVQATFLAPEGVPRVVGDVDRPERNSSARHVRAVPVRKTGV